MISVENKANNTELTDSDFTTSHYRELLQIAKKKYTIYSYEKISWESRFLLWRHDLDFSLNRALVLADIEQQEGIRATYFINPHAEFYNIAELSQHKIVKNILSFGHEIGLHFDGAFHDVSNKTDLDRLIKQEADYLSDLFDVYPTAFSFHNPEPQHLTFEDDSYGGLINCYSKRFKSEVTYCSDSNGYWRFRRLFEVLSEASDSYLQVLTHPVWWQEVPMPPRKRIFRSVYGRAEATMLNYDSSLEQHGRLNHAGRSEVLQVIKISHLKQFELCNYLWNKGHFQTLFVELWRIHEEQIIQLCMAHLRKKWQIPSKEINVFFSEDLLPVHGWKLFNEIFDQQWLVSANVDEIEYKYWVKTSQQIMHGSFTAESEMLEVGCVYICQVIKSLLEWCEKHSLSYDGLTQIGSIDLTFNKTVEGQLNEDLDSTDLKISKDIQKRWENLKKQFMNANNEFK